MNQRLFPNLTLIAAATSFLVQVGAGLFALTIIGRVLIAAPPRSLALLSGPYSYNSADFWQVMPPITGALLLLAAIANWKTDRRALIITTFVAFALSGVLTVVFVEPMFAGFAGPGYSDTVDAALQSQAATWWAADLGLRLMDLVSATLLLVALTRTLPPAKSGP